MTVAEFIKILEAFPQDAPIVMTDQWSHEEDPAPYLEVVKTYGESFDDEINTPTVFMLVAIL